MEFKIRNFKDGDLNKYKGNKSEYFKLPNHKPNDGFMWAQYQRRKIKRYDRGTKKFHGYWKLLKEDTINNDITPKKSDDKKNHVYTSINSNLSHEIELNTLLNTKKNKKKPKKKRVPAIPIQHLNLILGLLRFYLKQKEIPKSKTHLYDKCKKAFRFRNLGTGDLLLNKGDILVEIQEDINDFHVSSFSGFTSRSSNDGTVPDIAISKTSSKDDTIFNRKNKDDNRKKYKISWWNDGDGFDNCVALAIRKPSDETKLLFYLCFKAKIEEKIEWQWYDNDQSYFQKYDLGFDVFAQLEASFQACLAMNFPFDIVPNKHDNKNKKDTKKNKNKNKNNKTPNKSDIKNTNKFKRDDSPFNLPCIPEMVTAMKKNPATKKHAAEHYLIRYLFTKSKRIQDMEQLSVNKNQPEYPRRIKRMVAGTGQNTLFAYFLKESDFVHSWKERFLLEKETQIYYFWSFILAISTTMKYMQLELNNQFITFSFNRTSHGLDQSAFKGLDTSDLRREIRDLDLFKGFIVPPIQILQTQDVHHHEDILKPTDWWRTLSTVGVLKQLHFQNENNTSSSIKGTLRRLDTNANASNSPNDHEHRRTCKHDVQSYPYRGELGKVYCNRCASMMRFGEYLRKYSLEYENRELIQFLWPWHKNTFHSKDKRKYHEAIARNNFNFLFDSEDLLNYVPEHNIKEIIESKQAPVGTERYAALSQEYGHVDNDNIKHDIKSKKGLKSLDKKLEDLKVYEAHIRHKRKYVARFMLGAWESLRNLNIIKVQMGAVFEQLEIDRVHAETAAAAMESINIKFQRNKLNKADNPDDIFDNPDDILKAKQWKNLNWKEWLSKWNTKLNVQLTKDRPNWLMILKLNKFGVLKIPPKQLPNWDDFLEWALKPIYFINKHAYDSDDDEDDDSSDIDSDIDDDDADYNLSDSSSNSLSDNSSAAAQAAKVKSEARLHREMEHEWKNRFRSAWVRIPKWWHIGHDKVLIELGVLNQFNEKKYLAALTRRGSYYRMRLSQSIGQQDYTQDVAFQEFKSWCIRWENVMHRVRYISAVVARQLQSISPSIIELLIHDISDRPHWSCKSLVFLNDNQRITHINRIRELPKPSGFFELKAQKQKAFNEDGQYYDDDYDEELNENDLKDNDNLNVELENEKINAFLFKSHKSVARLHPKFEKTESQIIAKKLEELKENDDNNLFKECRIRDPFLIRDIGFELKEILNTIDLITYGEAMSLFVIELLRTRNLRSLWSFLGLLLKTMPNKVALRILHNNRAQLRRAKPEDLDWICRQVIQGTRFVVPACLFLSHFMKENAHDDLARNGVWESFSKKYEEFAAEQVSSIEDDFMLTMLMNIPVYMRQISLIQLALEQHNTLFLNTERVNRMITHIWFTPNPLNPHINFLAHKKNPKRTLRDAFQVLKLKPIYFYLTPFGYQWCISLLFTLYVIIQIIWIAHVSRKSIADKIIMYKITMGTFERIVWVNNLGFIIAEFVQFYSLGRAYFSVDGLTNSWDILISILWIVLAIMRFIFLFGYNDNTPLYQPPVSSFTRRRRRRLAECPDDFYECNFQYNSTCNATIYHGTNDENIKWMCDFDKLYDRRSLQDSSIPDSSFWNDVYYDEDELNTQSTDSNGQKCLYLNQTYNLTSSNAEFFNSIYGKYSYPTQSPSINDSNWYTSQVLTVKVCEPSTYTTQLLLVYNIIWSIQIAQLTMRLLLYYESCGGFFGILLRIVRSMIREVIKFFLIIVIVSTGFLFAIWSLYAHDINPTDGFTDLYDVIIFFFKLLFGGGNVGTIDTFYQNYRVFAQIIIMVFAIIGVRVFMSLLIALMSAAMNGVRSKAKAETAFTSALYAYELSTSDRIIPAPMNVIVLIEFIIIHLLNFLPALISPEYGNIYSYINQKRLYGCNTSSKRYNDITPYNHMNTRTRVILYYFNMFIPNNKLDWRIYHVGCYHPIMGIYGTEKMELLTTNEYYFILESKRKRSQLKLKEKIQKLKKKQYKIKKSKAKNKEKLIKNYESELEKLKQSLSLETRKLNVYDKLFLKHLTLKTLFCKYCFRALSLESLRDHLITPSSALINIISCYNYLLLWPFLIPLFYILCQIERLIQYWTEELRAHSPSLLKRRPREYDLEYFPRSAVKKLLVRVKTKFDFRRIGTAGTGDIDDIDVAYDEMEE